MKNLNIGGLVAQLPIIQGGMGVGISLSGLAGAVASQGGVGVISAAQPGFNWDGFDNNPLKANLQALAHHIRTAKEKAKGGLVGVNIMCALTNYAEYVKCAIEQKADLIISGAGLPSSLPELVKGTAVKIAPIVSSVKAATVLLRLWDKKYDYTADMVVVEGPRAGGHLGFSHSELEEDLRGTLHFDQQIKGVIETVVGYEEKFSKQIPTVFAGGIYDRADAAHYLDLGCAGVQIATRFVATEECDAAPEYKQAYIDAMEEDVVIVQSPVGMPGRALNNGFIKNLSNAAKITKCHSCIIGCTPAKIPYCITKALINAAKGLTEEGLIFCGAGVGRIKEMTTVKKLLGEFV